MPWSPVMLETWLNASWCHWPWIPNNNQQQQNSRIWTKANFRIIYQRPGWSDSHSRCALDAPQPCVEKAILVCFWCFGRDKSDKVASNMNGLCTAAHASRNNSAYLMSENGNFSFVPGQGKGWKFVRCVIEVLPTKLLQSYGRNAFELYSAQPFASAKTLLFIFILLRGPICIHIYAAAGFRSRHSICVNVKVHILFMFASFIYAIYAIIAPSNAPNEVH